MTQSKLGATPDDKSAQCEKMFNVVAENDNVFVKLQKQSDMMGENVN